jgi:hypothetical protein
MTDDVNVKFGADECELWVAKFAAAAILLGGASEIGVIVPGG